jgi:hypothetical protein
MLSIHTLLFKHYTSRCAVYQVEPFHCLFGCRFINVSIIIIAKRWGDMILIEDIAVTVNELGGAMGGAKTEVKITARCFTVKEMGCHVVAANAHNWDQCKLFIHALVRLQQLSPNTLYVECQCHSHE